MYNAKLKNEILKEAWSKITPSWPLQNIIACNPIAGFENMDFEEALKESAKYFTRKNLPETLEKINRINIKWCQVFFDKGQATISMPDKESGFYKSWKELAVFDDQIHGNSQEKISKLKNLPEDPIVAIAQSLKELKIDQEDQQVFITLMLTTLSGWSSYVKYLGEWSYQKDSKIMADYLAVRMVIAMITWQGARELLRWHKNCPKDSEAKNAIEKIKINEANHNQELIRQIKKAANQNHKSHKIADAQMVFCIDVRSEQFRRAIESVGNYQTFGFAGFFGIPIELENAVTNESHASCPVLLSPKHKIKEEISCSHHLEKKIKSGNARLNSTKKFYQSLKYNFTTPIPLAEGMGLWSGLWMFCRTIFPKITNKFAKNFVNFNQPKFESSPNIESISFEDRCNYAFGALKAMGFTKDFAKIVLFCGHGSATENNTYATSLDCGACGGRHGGGNAKILAKILNEQKVRESLKEKGIEIPQETIFVGAIHNTTTDEVEIYDGEISSDKLKTIKEDLEFAGKLNRQFRAKELGLRKSNHQEEIDGFIMKKSYSWSETQPEWGLAKNAAFIVGPRDLTKKIDLKGRAFLHSYDWEFDNDNAALNLILNAPMIVAQWINSQYLFSTLNNVAYGAGSKITANIAGKIGVMQGNASDLMNGLPLQSVYVNDRAEYHKPSRLMTLIYAPKSKIDQVISVSPKLEELFKNDWVHLYCFDPNDNRLYSLDRELNWKSC